MKTYSVKAVLKILGVAVLLVLLGPIAQAQEGKEDIESLQGELSRARKEVSANSKDLEKENEKLLAAEAALLNELMKNEAMNTSPAKGKSAVQRGGVNFNASSPLLKSEPLQNAAETKRQSEEKLGNDIKASVSLSKEQPAEALLNNDNSLGATVDKAIAEAIVSKDTLSHKTSVASAIRASEMERADQAIELDKASRKISGLQRQVSEMEELTSELRKENGELKAQLEGIRGSEGARRRELEETRNRLIIAEQEVKRLSDVIEARNRTTVARFERGSNPQTQPAVVARLKQPTEQRQAAVQSQAPAAQAKVESKSDDDMIIATVVADKANLRTGPGKDNSSLMAVARGTRLAVETRVGEWYRVIAPTGARAWVSKDVLAFGGNSQSIPSRTVRVKGYDASMDQEPF